MNMDRIKEIQLATAYPDSISVHQALLQVWNECQQERDDKNVVHATDMEHPEGYILIRCPVCLDYKLSNPDYLERINKYNENL